jgi:hypothetical protein
MSEFVVKLPNREKNIERLVRMPADERPKFIEDLCNVLWDHDADLPDEVKRRVHAWLAHRRFAEDPEVQARRAELRARIGEDSQ